MRTVSVGVLVGSGEAVRDGMRVGCALRVEVGRCALDVTSISAMTQDLLALTRSGRYNGSRLDGPPGPPVAVRDAKSPRPTDQPMASKTSVMKMTPNANGQVCAGRRAVETGWALDTDG
jgi:hypothetical protein